MKFAWSDATKMTAHAISSGRPRRWSGTSREAWAIIAGVFHTSSTPSVSTGPGATALTVMPCFAHSAPRLRVSTAAPAFAAAYAAIPREPLRPATEVTLMILPARCRIITRPTACEKRNTPVRFVATIASHSDRGRSSSGERIRYPALLTRISMRPNALRVCATAPSTCRASPTSHATASARRPSARTRPATGSSASLRRLHTTTSAPTRASSTAIARPIPWLAPVTIATRSRRVSAENATLLDDRARRRHQAGDLDLLAVDQGRDLRRDLVLPVVALVDQVVEPLALGLALESANPDVDALVFLADEAAEDDHAHLHLERDDLFFHALHPLLALAGTDVVLPQLEDHAGLQGSESPKGTPPAGPRERV